MLDETNAMFKAKVDGHNQRDYIEIGRPIHESMNGMHDVVRPDFDNANDAQLFLLEFWPFRFKLSKGGSCSIILSRLSFNDRQTDVHAIIA